MNTIITDEVLDQAREAATLLLVQWAETGKPPFDGDDAIDVDAAREALDDWIVRHRPLLIGSGVDFVFALIQGSLEHDAARYEALVSQMGVGAVLAEAQAVAEDQERLEVEMQSRRDALLELRDVAHQVARAALAAGITMAMAA